MGREIRRVPANWQHPKYVREGLRGVSVEYRPMYQRDYQEDYEYAQKEIKEWFERQELWNKGIYRDWNGKEMPTSEAMKMFLDSIEEDRKKMQFSESYKKAERMKYETGHCFWEDVAGKVPRLPNPDDYMPEGEWYQLFENVSEGTPITPAFATKEELIDWLANNKDFWGEQWTREQAEGMLKSNYAPSFVITNGVMKSGREVVGEGK